MSKVRRAVGQRLGAVRGFLPDVYFASLRPDLLAGQPRIELTCLIILTKQVNKLDFQSQYKPQRRTNMPMQRHELEEAIDKLIAASGVDNDQVVETLEMMLERYNEEADG